ncbi:MAG TPA: translocation/assembly module TamB domain-containing protein [Vulgatibacter sp.]|nr:translocation/assembly module TamB domain-containing protein [Vulgatibacter sp.]
MKRRWALKFLVLVAGTLCAAMLVLRTEWAALQLCMRAESAIGRILDGPFRIASCEIDPWRATVVAHGVHLGAGGDDLPELSIDRIGIDLSTIAFGPAMAIHAIELDRPEVVWTPKASSDGEGGSDGDGTCLSILDRLRVDALRIRDGTVRIRLGEGRGVTAGGIDLQVERRRATIARTPQRAGGSGAERYVARLRLAGSYEAEGADLLSLEALEAELELIPAEERLRVERLSARLPGLELGASGEVRDVCAPILALRVQAGGDLAVLAGHAGMDSLTGRFVAEARIDGPAAAPSAGGKVDLEEIDLDGYGFGDLVAAFHVGGGRLLVDELLWPIGDGRARITADVELTGDLPMEVEVRTEALEFHRLMTRLTVQNTPVMMVVDSVHRLSGKLGGGFVLEGTSSLEMRSFRVRNVPWHAPAGTVVVEVPGKAQLETRTRITADNIFLDGARIDFGPGTHLDLSARLGFEEERGLTIHARATHIDLAHVASHIAGLPVAGAGEITAIIDGPYADPIIEGDLDLDEARLFTAELGRVRSHAVSYPGRHTLDFHQVVGTYGATTYDGEVKLILGDAPTIEARASAREGGRIQDVWSATGPLLPPLAWMKEHLGGRIHVLRGKVSGPLPDVAGEGRIELVDARFLDRPFDRLQADVELPGIHELRLSGLRLTRGEGAADADAGFHFPSEGAPRVHAVIEARDLPIRDLLGEFGEWADLEGVVGANARLSGDVDALVLTGEIFGEGLAARGVDLASTRLSLETQGDQVNVRGVLLGAGPLSASLRLVESLPFDAGVDLAVGDLSRFLPEDLGIGGVLRGTLLARGSLVDVMASEGELALTELQITSGDFQANGVGETRLSFAGRALDLHRFELRGPNTSLSLRGSRDAAGVLDLHAAGAFDARLVEKLLPQIEYAGGVISLQAALTGRSEFPILVGSAQVRDGAFRVKALPIQVQSLQSNLAFSQNQVVIEDARLGVNGGQATLGGTVSLRRFAPDRFDLVLNGTNMTWRKPADWPAVVSGRVTLSGGWPDDLLLGGELNVERLRYARDLELEKAMLDFRRRFHATPSADEEERIRFDLDLVGGRDMRIDNNLIRARLQFVGSPTGGPGRLKLVGSNVRMGLLGSVEVLEGTAFFRGNEYRLTHGMVDFSERDRIDPAFDVTAETEVRDYRIAARAYGRLGDDATTGYHLDLRSEPSLAQADIVTLLTFGITSWDLDRGGNAALGAGVAAEALLAVSGLDEHVKRWLPQTPILMDPDLSVTSQYSELTGQMEPMAVFETKVLTDRFRLKAAAPFATTKGRRASAEMKVSERLSTQLIWQNEVVGYSSGDLGIDLKLRWEWE